VGFRDVSRLMEEQLLRLVITSQGEASGGG